MFEQEENPVCTTCGSRDIVKHGLRYNMSTVVQKYRCKSCGYCWSAGRRRRYKFPQEIIEFAVGSVKQGHSCRDVSQMIKTQFNRTVSNITVWHWATKIGGVKYSRVPRNEAKHLLIKTILKHLTYSDLAEETGLKYYTVKTFFQRHRTKEFKQAKRSPQTKFLARRIRDLERKLNSVSEELENVKKAFGGVVG